MTREKLIEALTAELYLGGNMQVHDPTHICGIEKAADRILAELEAERNTASELEKLVGDICEWKHRHELTDRVRRELNHILSRYDKPAESLACCNMCGSRLIAIRGKYPKEPDRIICPWCIVEKLEDIVSGVSNSTGVQDIALPDTKEGGRGYEKQSQIKRG
jgi:hypothetical protein